MLTDTGFPLFANKIFANYWRNFRGCIGEIPEIILAKVHLNFANWRVSIGYIGEGSLDFRQTDHSTPE